jgi:(p)ppGpp synthase/HD superfamily hydrolase
VKGMRNLGNFRYIQSLAKCAEFATRVHKNQTRKDGITPYSVHLGRVATLAATYEVDYLALMVAWLHDTLEDHPGCRNDLESMISTLDLSWEEKAYIMTGITLLTKNSSITPRSARVTLAIGQLRNADDAMRIVKICDRIDNLSVLEGLTPSFINLYLSETERIVEALEFDVPLFGKYYWKSLYDLKMIVAELRGRNNEK